MCRDSDRRSYRDVPVAVININGPELNSEDNLKVLANFGQLDELLQST